MRSLILRVLAPAVMLLTQTGAAHGRGYTLKTYAQAILDASPEVVEARASLDKAKANHSSELFDAVLPTLGFTAAGTPYGHSSTNGNRFNRWKMSDKDSTFTTTLSLNLFNSFRDYLGVRSARLAKESSDHGLSAVLLRSTLSAVKAFYDLSLKKKLLEVAEQDFSARIDQFRLTESLYKSGMKNLPDLLKSETDKLSSELRLATARAQNEQSLLEFNTLLNDPSWEEASLQMDLQAGTTELPRISRGLRKAVLERPEVRKARADLEKANVSLRLKRYDLFPDFSIDFDLTQREAAIANAADPNPNYQMGLTLSLPTNFNIVSQVYNFFSARSETRRAAASLDGKVRDVRKDVHSAHTSLERSLISYRVSTRKEEISKKNLDLVKEQYRQGSADVIRLSEAQLDHLNARVSSARTLHNIFTNRAAYTLATGEFLW